MPWQTLPGSEPFPAELVARLERAVGQDSLRPPGRRFVNRLALESSPYLRQHDDNPVSWFPWGDEAFAEARRLRRPVFLSIGYSTCHWCHVMAEESFADETIAAFLNAHYVAVKVDREERPDIDAVYMRAAQMLGGGGGWPLSVWLTDEREPFFAGTYFPPYSGMRGSGLGFLDCLRKLLEVYQNEPPRVREVSQKVIATMRAVSDSGVGDGHSVASVEREGPALLATATAALNDDFDEQYGGLRLTQKFPSHVPVRLLLRQHRRTGDVQALHMAVRTLEAMAAGGIYDHLGGGFHRYSTDPAWRVPHFEKMLYDNALLVLAYVEAWQVTHNDRFARIARETCDALLTTFAAPSGGFFSATDADSEGEEGKYFVWTEAEARSALGTDERAELFLRYFGLVGDGELGSGRVLHEERPDEEVRRSLEDPRARLLEVRSRRVAPQRDEKILSAWNGLTISALAVAGRTLGELRYLEAAARAADFVLSELRNPVDGGLLRSVCDGRKGGPGFLDDFAFVVAGFLDLFESSSEQRWFDAACDLAEKTEREFADTERGGWFPTGPEHERLFLREKRLYDGAEPAGGSVALMNAARLAAFTGDEKWRRIVEKALAFYVPLLRERPLAMTEALLAVDFCAGPVREIVLAIGAGEETGSQELSRVLHDTFCPRKVMVAGNPGSADWSKLQDHIPFLRDKVASAGITTAYVCEGSACRRPTTDPVELAKQLGDNGIG